MNLPFKLLSTDFDGTLHADHENPPVPENLQKLIGQLQEQGVKWAINTGRDLSSLMEGIARSRLSIMPDYVVIVEREIYSHSQSRFIACEDWNLACTRAHQQLFESIEPDLPRLIQWVNARYSATVYEDPYSPFCLIAGDNREADAITDYLNGYSREVPGLTVVRNDVYARFSHVAYNKGTALAEIGRRLGIGEDEIAAAGDHFNDLPMLSRKYARWLIAPSNAISSVKEAVQQQQGFVSQQPWGHGLAQGLEHFLELANLDQLKLNSMGGV
jgi:HAD superfamily hydrolase (TIGR01484 family)